MRRVWGVAMALVIALAIGLRFFRLHWGLADELYFADETVWMIRLRAFDHLSLKSFDTTQLGYPTLYPIVGGIGSWLLGLAGWETRGAMGVGWMRIVAATSSVLAVLVTMRLGVAMYGPWVGIVAAALLAAAPLEVMQVHYASVEPMLVLFTTVAMATSWRLAHRGTLGAAALAGTAAGLATGSKYPGLAFFSAAVWAIGEHWWRHRSFGTAVRLAAVAALAMVVSFVLACPSCVLHFEVLGQMLNRHRMMAAFAAFQGACLVPEAGWWHRPWVYEIVAGLPYGMGLPFALLGFAGVLVALWRRAPADRLLLATLIPYFAYMGSSSVVYPRYMLPLFPALALLGAAALPHTARPRLATALAGVVLAYTLTLTATQLGRFSWNQQAAVADWLGDRLPLLPPDDRSVAIPAAEAPDPYFKLRTPIEAKGFKIDLLAKDVKVFAGRPTFVVLPEWFAMVSLRDRRDFLLTARLKQVLNEVVGYRAVLRVPIPPYLQHRWDESWDPTFAVELWQGAIGFTVYARKDVLPEQKVEVLPPLPSRRSADAAPP